MFVSSAVDAKCGCCTKYILKYVKRVGGASLALVVFVRNNCNMHFQVNRGARA